MKEKAKVLRKRKCSLRTQKKTILTDLKNCLFELDFNNPNLCCHIYVTFCIHMKEYASDQSWILVADLL